jgi:four helix bundle protein
MDALQGLEVWRRACRFSVEIYKLVSRCREYGFRDQLGRSALSIASNIAEGYERGSRKERVQFLRIAKGSCGEAWTQLLIGVEAGFIDKTKGLEKSEEAKEIAKTISGLITHFEKGLKSPST